MTRWISSLALACLAACGGAGPAPADPVEPTLGEVASSEAPPPQDAKPPPPAKPQLVSMPVEPQGLPGVRTKGVRPPLTLRETTEQGADQEGEEGGGEPSGDEYELEEPERE